MNKSHLTMFALLVVAYFVGAKFPGIAHKTGLV